LLLLPILLYFNLTGTVKLGFIVCFPQPCLQYIYFSKQNLFLPVDIAGKINLPGDSEPQLLANSSLMFLRHSIVWFLVIKLTIEVLLFFPKNF